MSFIWFLLIGLIAGWLAGQFMGAGNDGMLGDLILGVVGAVLGGFLFRLLGFQAVGLMAKLITATVGACLFIATVRKIKRA
ncbi:MAG: GlsB/YeaQ/YmgE family stress response membrane protein [Bythopirellula sp.]